MTTRVVVHPANHEVKITVTEGDQTTEHFMPDTQTVPHMLHIYAGKKVVIEEVPTELEQAALNDGRDPNA